MSAAATGTPAPPVSALATRDVDAPERWGGEGGVPWSVSDDDDEELKGLTCFEYHRLKRQKLPNNLKLVSINFLADFAFLRLLAIDLPPPLSRYMVMVSMYWYKMHVLVSLGAPFTRLYWHMYMVVCTCF